MDLEKAFDSVWIFGLLFILHILHYPIDFIQLVWNMTRNRSFATYNGTDISSIFFDVLEDLLQGTVNSPELVNIFTYYIPNLFNLNTDNNTYSAGFADDCILLAADKDPKRVELTLENLFNRTIQEYRKINLKANYTKCETILFHKPLRFLTQSKRNSIKSFQIHLHDNAGKHPIERKSVVKYPGVHLDYLLRMNFHIDTQLNKARKSFKAYSRIFFNKSLSHRAEVVCYLLIIRPLLSYACPIWWNFSASKAEKIRKFERSCLRASLHTYRQTNSKKFVSNRTLYNIAKIPRIDNYLIKLTRDYLSNLKSIQNSHTDKFHTYDIADCKATALTGYIPPHYFMYFDNAGLI